MKNFRQSVNRERENASVSFKSGRDDMLINDKKGSYDLAEQRSYQSLDATLFSNGAEEKDWESANDIGLLP